MSALAIGAMTPDLAYCYTWLLGFHLGLPHFSRPLPETSHSLIGLFQFSLPVGLVAWLLFHSFFKRPLLAFAPPSHRRRLTPVADRFAYPMGWQWARVAAGLLVGALSHLAWDRVTHASAWELVAWLGSPRLQAVGYGLLQIGSTLVALSYLAWTYWRWYAIAPVAPLASPKSDPCLTLLLLVFCLLAIGSALVVFQLLSRPPARWSFSFLYSSLEHSVASSTVAGGIVLTLFSCWWHLRRRIGPPSG